MLGAARYALERGRPGVRLKAIDLLRQYFRWDAARYAADVVPLLLRARRDPSPRVRLVVLNHLLIGLENMDGFAPMLMEALDDADDDVRAFALGSCRGLSPRAVRTLLPALLRSLRGEDETLAAVAADVLPRFARDDRRVLPALLDVYRRTRSDSLREAILGGVVGLGEPGRAFLPLLLPDARNEESPLHETALAALAALDPKDSLLPRAAARLLGRRELDLSHLGDLSSGLMTARLGLTSVPSIVALLDSPDARLRLGALMAVGTLVADDKKAGTAVEPSLRRALADANGRVRLVAAGALWQLTKMAPPLLPVLTRALKSADPIIRREAGHLLQQMGPAVAPALPALVEALQSPYPGVRQDVLTVLGQIGPKAADAVPALVRLLDDCGSSRTRIEVVRVLDEVGKAARVAVPALRELAQDPDRACCGTALGALSRIGTPRETIAAAVALVRQLGTDPEDEQLRHALVTFLPGLGGPVVKDMLGLLKDRRTDLRAFAAEVLGGVGPPAKAALPALLAALKDKNEDVALEAAAAAWQVGRRREGAAVLGRLLASRRRNVRLRAVGALHKMAPAASDAVPALLAALDGPDHALRAEAEAVLHDHNLQAAAGYVPKNDK